MALDVETGELVWHYQQVPGENWDFTAVQQMTLAEFNRRYPSTISIEELAIINQVEGGGTRLPAGTRVLVLELGC